MVVLDGTEFELELVQVVLYMRLRSLGQLVLESPESWSARLHHLAPILLVHLLLSVDTGRLFRPVAMAAHEVTGPLKKIRPDVQRFLAKHSADGQKRLTRHDISVIKGLFEEDATVWSASGKLPQEQQQELYNLAAILWVQPLSLQHYALHQQHHEVTDRMAAWTRC